MARVREVFLYFSINCIFVKLCGVLGGVVDFDTNRVMIQNSITILENQNNFLSEFGS